jgi:hypothetical protein
MDRQYRKDLQDDVDPRLDYFFREHRLFLGILSIPLD